MTSSSYETSADRICVCGHPKRLHPRAYAHGETGDLAEDACREDDSHRLDLGRGFVLNRELSGLAGVLTVPEEKPRGGELQAKLREETEASAQKRAHETGGERAPTREGVASASPPLGGTLPNETERRPFSEATFRNGELVIVVHTEATAYRMYERKHTAIPLTAEATANLARELLASLAPEAALALAREVFAYAESA